MDSLPKQPNCKLLLLTPQNIDPFPPFYPYVTPKNILYSLIQTATIELHLQAVYLAMNL